MRLCPECHCLTEVLETRNRKDGVIHRRRVCQACAFRFTTEEVDFEEAKALRGLRKILDQLRK